MLFFRPLPWEFAIRNLLRRPLRSGLTFVGLTVVILLSLAVIGFVRGLQRSLENSGDRQTALVFGLGMGQNLEYSSIAARTADLLAASLQGVKQRQGRKYVSPELYMATNLRVGDREEPSMGLVRGVTPEAVLVRRQVQLTEGDWPRPGEVLVGRLAATKLHVAEEELRPGKTIYLEGEPFKISGTFSAAGSVFGSEVWLRLDELQQVTERQDLSIVAITLDSSASLAEVKLFCGERSDLELQAMSEIEYFQSLKEDYQPIKMMAWMVAGIVTAGGVFAGLNTMYGSVMGRVSELATLQTIGFARRAVLLSLIQEGVLLSVAASLVAALLAAGLVHNMAVRFTMGAFELNIDSLTLLIGLSIGLVLGLTGAIFPAIRALRIPLVDGLKSA